MAEYRDPSSAVNWLEAHAPQQQVKSLEDALGSNLLPALNDKLSGYSGKSFADAEDSEVLEAVAALFQETSPSDQSDEIQQGPSLLASMDNEFSAEIPKILFENTSAGLDKVMEEIGEQIAGLLQRSKAALNEEGRAYLESVIARYLYDEIYAGLVEAMQENGDNQGKELSASEIQQLLQLPDAW
jgi:hypothetical protein